MKYNLEHYKFKIVYLFDSITIIDIFAYLYLLGISITIYTIINGFSFANQIGSLLIPTIFYLFYVVVTFDWNEYHKYKNKKDTQI